MSTTNPDGVPRYDFIQRDDGWDESCPADDGAWVKHDDHARMTTDLRQLLGQARGLLAEGDADKAEKMLVAMLGVLDGEET